jgi:hypothetical protein
MSVRCDPVKGLLAGGLAVGFAEVVIGPAILASADSLLGVGGGAPAASSAATAQIHTAMLTLYQQAAATCPGLPWTILAAIGTVESDNGQSDLPGVHSGANAAGAEGPMQFEPATFPSGDMSPPGPTESPLSHPGGTQALAGTHVNRTRSLQARWDRWLSRGAQSQRRAHL